MARILKTSRLVLLSCMIIFGAQGAFGEHSPGLAAESPFIPGPIKKRAASKAILFLGDSLTAGYGLQLSEAYPTLIQKKIDRLGWDFEVINAGLSGETTAGGLRRVNWLMRRKIDVLVLALGGNDGLRGIAVDATRQNLQGVIDRAKKKYPHLRVVIAGMQMPPNLGPDYTVRFRSVFPELAKKNKAALIPFLLDGVAGDPELTLPDRIHPTAKGHKIIAENVWKVLEPVLRSLR